MDPYDDPTIFGKIIDREDNFPPTLKFTEFGDRVMGRIKQITSANFGDPDENTLKYVLVDVSAVQQGRSARLDRAEVLLSPVNLLGQLRTLHPREGEIIDIEYQSDGKRKGKNNPPKYFRVEIVGDRPEPFGGPTPMEALDERRQQWEPRNEQPAADSSSANLRSVDPDADIFTR